MSNDNSDWESKYWANRQRQLDTLPKVTPNTSNYKEVDLTSALLGRANQTNNHQTPSQQTVHIKEGSLHYKEISMNGFYQPGNKMVVDSGNLTNVQNVEFIFGGQEEVLRINDRTKPIDFNKIHEMISLGHLQTLNLYKIRSAFSGGFLYVEKNSIIENINTNKTVLLG